MQSVPEFRTANELMMGVYELMDDCLKM